MTSGCAEGEDCKAQECTNQECTNQECTNQECTNSECTNRNAQQAVKNDSTSFSELNRHCRRTRESHQVESERVTGNAQRACWEETQWYLSCYHNIGKWCGSRSSACICTAPHLRILTAVTTPFAAGAAIGYTKCVKLFNESAGAKSSGLLQKMEMQGLRMWITCDDTVGVIRRMFYKSMFTHPEDNPPTRFTYQGDSCSSCSSKDLLSCPEGSTHTLVHPSTHLPSPLCLPHRQISRCGLRLRPCCCCCCSCRPPIYLACRVKGCSCTMLIRNRYRRGRSTSSSSGSSGVRGSRGEGRGCGRHGARRRGNEGGHASMRVGGHGDLRTGKRGRRGRAGDSGVGVTEGIGVNIFHTVVFDVFHI